MAIHKIEKDGDIIRITYKHTVEDINGVPFERVSGTKEIDIAEYKANIDRCDSQIASYQAEKSQLEETLVTLNLELVGDVVVDKVVEVVEEIK